MENYVVEKIHDGVQKVMGVYNSYLEAKYNVIRDTCYGLEECDFKFGTPQYTITKIER